MGNLTRNPEIRHTPSGTAVVDLGLAVNEEFINKAGEKIEQTVFVDVTVWGKQAESCNEYLTKGSQAFIDGKLQLDQWKTKEGENRSKLRVKADRVQFLSSGVKSEKRAHSNENASQSAQPRPEPESEDDESIPF